jgi:hypothetical protein
VNFARRARAAAGRWAALFALALLWSQGVGLLHGIAHAPHGASVAAAPAPAAGLGGLFALHDEASAACLVFDAATQGAALCASASAFAALPVPDETCDETIAPPQVATAVPFLARAPPRRA